MSGCFTLGALVAVAAGFFFTPFWLLAVGLGILALVFRNRRPVVIVAQAPTTAPADAPFWHGWWRRHWPEVTFICAAILALWLLLERAP
jgi:hypothetical protein